MGSSLGDDGENEPHVQRLTSPSLAYRSGSPHTLAPHAAQAPKAPTEESFVTAQHATRTSSQGPPSRARSGPYRQARRSGPNTNPTA